MELIKEALPTLTRVAVLVNPANLAHPIALAAMESTAGALGVELTPIEVKARDDIAAAIAAAATRRAAALVAIEDGAVYFKRQTNCGLRTAEPTADDWVQASGGSWRAAGIWSGSCRTFFRRSAAFVDQGSEGRPAGPPAGSRAPTKYELVINLKTAKALGLDSAGNAARTAPTR